MNSFPSVKPFQLEDMHDMDEDEDFEDDTISRLNEDFSVIDLPVMENYLSLRGKN